MVWVNKPMLTVSKKQETDSKSERHSGAIRPLKSNCTQANNSAYAITNDL